MCHCSFCSPVEGCRQATPSTSQKFLLFVFLCGGWVIAWSSFHLWWDPKTYSLPLQKRQLYSDLSFFHSSDNRSMPFLFLFLWFIHFSALPFQLRKFPMLSSTSGCGGQLNIWNHPQENRSLFISHIVKPLVSNQHNAEPHNVQFYPWQLSSPTDIRYKRLHQHNSCISDCTWYIYSLRTGSKMVLSIWYNFHDRKFDSYLGTPTSIRQSQTSN